MLHLKGIYAGRCEMQNKWVIGKGTLHIKLPSQDPQI